MQQLWGFESDLMQQLQHVILSLVVSFSLVVVHSCAAIKIILANASFSWLQFKFMFK